MWTNKKYIWWKTAEINKFRIVNEIVIESIVYTVRARLHCCKLCVYSFELVCLFQNWKPVHRFKAFDYLAICHILFIRTKRFKCLLKHFNEISYLGCENKAILDVLTICHILKCIESVGVMCSQSTFSISAKKLIYFL